MREWVRLVSEKGVRVRFISVLTNFFVIERDSVLAVRKDYSLPLSVTSRFGLSKRHSPLLTIIFSICVYLRTLRTTLTVTSTLFIGINSISLWTGADSRCIAVYSFDEQSPSLRDDFSKTAA
jgi:hypothetical protein